MLNKIIAIGGEPGTGKTTLLKEFVKGSIINKIGSVTFHEDKNNKLVILGVYDGKVNDGTDRLSMSIQPRVIDFLNKISIDCKYNNYSVLFEGDRLYNAKFFDAIKLKYNLILVLLTSDECVKTDRYKQRGTNQGDTFLQGRKTKYNNLISKYNINILRNNTQDEFIFNKDKIEKIIINNGRLNNINKESVLNLFLG